ncbi:plasmid replication initiator TrfA [Pseudomonas sp.]|uniref:plasmid replication initiator TrfA n=1 Tax=Pseudomonas sp. TaxID=306 RepID=UPI002BF64568|nr:plasmid replication initiator TrfA [Pseudomonas sp.]HUE91868.1 plasmid replication initiator TrfA [Pseudomonas sp.]
MPIPSRIFTRLEERNKRSAVQSQGMEVEQVRSLLPNWSDSVRRVPNVALRSALFGAMGKGERPYVERLEIHAQGGVSILYTGVMLDQLDLDVWETVLHMVRSQELGAECRITAYQLLKELGKTDTGKNRKILSGQLSRMKATALQLRVGDYSYEGSLINEVYRDHGNRTKSYVIRLNPKLLTLFESDQFTDVDWSVRQALRGKPIAKWLHGYYASHANPFRLKVETLYRLCGSQASSLVDFSKDLIKALDSLERASNSAGQPFSYAIEGDLVRVKTTPSPSQRRHLDNKL